MKTIALYNPASGSVTADGGEKLRAALEGAGVRGADFVELDRSGCDQQLKQLANADPDLLVVWGGDGTLRSALTLAGQTPNLLLLPGGTMNLLTKSIHGEKTWDVILKEVLARPRRKVIPAGRANDEHFYCAMLAGAPARLAEAREALRRGELVKAAAEARAALETLGNLNLEARYRDGYTFERSSLPPTSIVGVLVGPVARDAEMEVAALSEPTPGAALSVIWSSFISDWRSAPNVTVVPARSLVIESGDGDIPVIIDGEAMEVGDVVRVSYVKEAAQCLTAG
ncbi:MAG TPA: diacylglycerol kinase family protein [Hyphomonadaceae bacterium]|jgi:diacylglycerol kinase family enzyme